MISSPHLIYRALTLVQGVPQSRFGVRERAFENRIWETVREGEKKCDDYHTSFFERMVVELGAIDAVKKLLHMPHPSEGFTILVMCRHPELTSEAVACDRRWSCLFMKEEISTAKKMVERGGVLSLSGERTF